MSDILPYKQIKKVCKHNGFGEVNNIYKKEDGLFYCHTRKKPVKILCISLSNPFNLETSCCEILY